MTTRVLKFNKQLRLVYIAPLAIAGDLIATAIGFYSARLFDYYLTVLAIESLIFVLVLSALSGHCSRTVD